MSSTMQRSAGMVSAPMNRVKSDIGMLDKAAAAFGLSAAITIVFNTVLAWIKDAYDPLNSFMASLTGHHWITHGLANIAVFVILGLVFMRMDVRMDGTRFAMLIATAIVVGGGGLALWFILF